ncbi:hypothetical protein CAPTEDRAFT_191719 [Capitella teleta]|uniref:Uncharacterized protein n=1 Tax=Capitella teleta TaxID=283909 RepID=R7U1K8_CAPTE|nr:hypothetical protein CAPTEDRAFT_191719 [Capitella teleta]|eukprot:ELT97075.1 hypothetical protein CAPTEDRAFT_191719 [Capitella teleta]
MDPFVNQSFRDWKHAALNRHQEFQTHKSATIAFHEWTKRQHDGTVKQSREKRRSRRTAASCSSLSTRLPFWQDHSEDMMRPEDKIYIFVCTTKNEKSTYHGLVLAIFQSKSLSPDAKNHIKEIQLRLQKKNIREEGKKRRQRIVEKIFYLSTNQVQNDHECLHCGASSSEEICLFVPACVSKAGTQALRNSRKWFFCHLCDAHAERLPLDNALLRSISALDPSNRGRTSTMKKLKRLPAMAFNVLNAEEDAFALEKKALHVKASIDALKEAEEDDWFKTLYETCMEKAKDLKIAVSFSS